MKDFRQQLRQRLSQQKLGKLGLAQLCLSSAEKFFGNKYKIEGYLKNNIFFISTKPEFAKNDVFLHKAKLLDYLHEQLQKYGYKTKIKDIRIK